MHRSHAQGHAVGKVGFPRAGRQAGGTCVTLVISVSVLGLRGARSLDRVQRTCYQGGILAGEDCRLAFVVSVSVLCCGCVSSDCQCSHFSRRSSRMAKNFSLRRSLAGCMYCTYLWTVAYWLLKLASQSLKLLFLWLLKRPRVSCTVTVLHLCLLVTYIFAQTFISTIQTK